MLDTNMKDRIALILLGMVICLAGMNALKAQENQDEGLGLATPLEEPIFGAPVEGQDRVFVNTNVGSPDDSKTTTKSQEKVVIPSNLFSIQEVNGKTDARKIEQQISVAVKTLRNIEDPAAKEKVAAELSQRMKKYFTLYFEEDMQQREEKFAPLEARVKKMRAYLEKRQAAKEKIIDLQIQVILNQADGLGLITTPDEFEPVRQSSTFEPFGFGTPPTPIPVGTEKDPF